jgi:CheY-like chemotaxis protein
MSSRPPADAPRPVIRPLDPGGPPILVVDDLADGAALSRAMLEAGGYEVVDEAEGDAVLRLVRSAVMRCVVTEIYIPCAEGRCVVTALKGERRRLPRLRVLVHTRHRSADDLAWALDAGSDGVLHKPAESRVLLREVRRLDAVGDASPHHTGDDRP